MPFPFEVAFEEVRADLDRYVDAVFGSLQSEFLTLPKGGGFLEFPAFEQGYEALKWATRDFREVSAETVIATVYRVPVVLIVLRSILGFTPPEWAYVTTQRTGIEVPQGAARTLDRTVRLKPTTPLPATTGVTGRRIHAMVRAACELLTGGAPVDERAPELIHRLDKADTRGGLASIQPLADLGVPYTMLLYERFLGRLSGVNYSFRSTTTKIPDRCS